MTDAQYIYVVRFWVAPEAKAEIMRWLEGGHVAEVVSQPGFLWCRRFDLAETDAEGWEAYSMVYGIASRAHFETHAANTALAAKFAEQRAPFAHALRLERFHGEVTLAVDK